MRKEIFLTIMLAAVVLLSTTAFADNCPCPTAIPGVAFFQGDESWGMGGSYLGVDTRDVTSDRVAALKLKDESGVEVTMVDQDAPAGKAGLKEKDVILSFNNQKVEGVEQLRRMIREVPPGRQVALGISRDGQPVNINVTLGDRKLAMKNNMRKRVIVAPGGNVNAMPMPMVDMGPIDMDIPSVNVFMTNSNRSGVMVENLTSQLAEYFGVKGNAGGVLVRSVEKGSAAEVGGLKAGDVIVKIDKEKIADLGDWRRATRGHSGPTAVVVVRDKREQTLQVKFPERKPKDNSRFIKPGDFNFDFDFDNDFDFDQIAVNMEKLRPQIELATREVEKHRAEIEKAMKESVNAEKIQKEVNKEVQKALKEQKKAMEEFRKEWSVNSDEDEE